MTGHWTGISQLDLVLLVIPVTVALVVLGDVNGDAMRRAEPPADRSRRSHWAPRRCSSSARDGE